MDKFAPLKDLLCHFTKIGPCGCAITVSQKGKAVFSHFEGVSDLESARAVGEDTIFQLHSNSKLMTVAAAMQLYENGAFTLNDPVEEYLPEFKDTSVLFYTGNNTFSARPPRSKICIQQLMNMTDGSAGWVSSENLSPAHSGILNIYRKIQNEGKIALRDFSRAAARVPLLFDPGTSFNYGVGCNIVAALVEVLSGMKLSEYLRKEIFQPLGMKDTGFFIPPEKADRAAKMYSPGEDGKPAPNYEHDWRFKPGLVFENASGGLVSTISDMDRFAGMLANGGSLDGVRVLGRKTIDLIRQNHLRGRTLNAFRRTHENGWEAQAGYGFGLCCRVLIDRTLAGSNGTEGEYGWYGAAGTWQLIDPVEELAVTYAHNLLPNSLVNYCHPRLRAVLYGCLS